MSDRLAKSLAELRDARAVLAHTLAHIREETAILQSKADRSYARIESILLDLVRIIPQVLRD